MVRLHDIPDLPTYVADAFIFVHGDSPGADRIETFASRWGEPDATTFLHILKEGTGDDLHIAIYGLGKFGLPKVLEAIQPFLDNPSRQTQWITAISLSYNNQQNAYLQLCQMILEDIFPDPSISNYQERVDYRYYIYIALKALRSSNDPRVLALYRQALDLLWQCDTTGGYSDHLNFYYYQDFAYEAGRRSIFDLTKDLPLPAPYRAVMFVQLAMGYLKIDERPDFSWSVPRYELYNNSDFQQEVIAVLIEKLGVAPEDAQYYVSHFEEIEKEGEEIDLAAYPGQQTRHQDTSLQLAVEEDDEDEDDEDEVDEESIDPIMGYNQPECDCVYVEHTATINAMSYSHSGEYVVTASDDQTVHVWNAHTGDNRLIFRGHTAAVNTAAWSPNDKFIASAGCDRQAYVWNAETGEIITHYNQHQALITQLVWSPDGNRIASTSWDKTVRIWDAHTGQTFHTYQGHNSIIWCVGWSPDGQLIVSGSGAPECEIHFWKSNNGELMRIDRRSHGDQNSIRYVLWSPDGHYLASTSLHGIFQVQDIGTGDLLVNTYQTSGPLVWSPDSNFLAGPINIGGVNIWSIQPKFQKIIHYFQQKISRLPAIAWSPDGSHVAAIRKGKEVLVWQLFWWDRRPQAGVM